MKRPTVKVQRGRPKGSKNVMAPMVPVELGHCPKCGSTDRRRIRGRPPRVFAHAGLNGQGRPYSHIVWRHCECSACGQRFMERTYEHRPAGEGGRPPGRAGRGRQRKGSRNEQA